MTEQVVAEDAVRGLTEAEAVLRRAGAGPNALPPTPGPAPWARLAAQLRDPLVLLLLVAGAATLALRDWTDAAVIGLVVIMNTTVGLVQEARADRAVAELQRLAAPHARVVRDGTVRVLPAVDLVPGDLVRLDAGDVVPADVTLSVAERLLLDEAVVTGESVPVTRAPGEQLQAGTSVLTGRGAGRVTRTGPDSALGRIAMLVSAVPVGRTPLQRRLAGLGRALGAGAVLLSLVVLVDGLFRDQPLETMVVVAISLTVAAVPESLPAVVTVALALGAHRMARRHAVVRRLPAVETLGSVTVIASDKTGTLTTGRMAVEMLVAGDGIHRLDGHGGPDAADGAPTADLRRLARDILLCNDAGPIGADGGPAPVGDPMEAALVTAAHRSGVPEAVREAHPRLTELPFDADRRRMTTVHRAADGILVVCKGAPDVLAGVPGLLADPPDVVAGYLAEAERLAAGGHRVLAVADAIIPARLPPADPERDLHLAGLAVFVDPLRPDAADVVATFHRAGIRVVLITGDHPATASSVARRVGIDTTAGVVSGDRLDLAEVDGAGVYARIRPEQKLDLVSALQGRGEVVAMTGDGVNDAPALRRADIGVALGQGGSEAARQAADLVLTDDDLTTMAAAVEEGRRVYANIRRFLVFAISGGLAEVLVMLTGPWLGLALPLLPAQILWVNLLTHGLTGVALGVEPPDRGAMDAPPRRPGAAILGGGMAAQVAVIGAAIAAVSLGTALWASATGLPWQSMLFVTLGMAQLGVALAVRARPARGGERNIWLPVALGVAFVLQVAAVTVTPLRTVLGTLPLGWPELAVCVLAGALPGLLLAGARTVWRVTTTVRAARH